MGDRPTTSGDTMQHTDDAVRRFDEPYPGDRLSLAVALWGSAGVLALVTGLLWLTLTAWW